jgi:hypothetical protein
MSSFGVLQNTPEVLSVTDLRVQNVIPVKLRKLCGENAIHAACREAPEEEATALPLTVELEAACLPHNPGQDK